MTPPDLSRIADFTRTWGKTESKRARSVVEHDALVDGVAAIEANLARRPARSTLLVGGPGVGKTAYTLSLGRELRRQGWTVIEASASDLMSGQSYIGQLDLRIRDLVSTMTENPRLLWICPAFHELVWAGRHMQSPVGVLELLMPHLEAGAVRVVGETSPAAYELMCQVVPKVRSVLETVRVSASDSPAARTIAEARYCRKKRGPIAKAVVAEASRLADQFLLSRENPGRLLDLLETTKQRVLTDGAEPRAITLDDVLTTLSVRTGMPKALLDDREPMELREVRGWFQDRILGQSEAVRAVVERIALTKAGLTDPTRPLGVFLFVGPTGTGKTEIAKALATFLFRSPSRLLRLDMSEFQDPSSVDRILGERGSTADPSALVTRIRENPFSIVLLDEFEKAHPAVWDLFLQLFDDGRLTARDGTTADFRNAIVIMTSNLGAADANAPGLGFGSDPTRFEPSTIKRTLELTFRPEFLNRIDRIVLFRPLTRPVMRKLLDLELRSVYERRGLRRRGWAIEWDEAALEHLLDHGFSPTLGARPLKRAVEQLFLAPLAEVIVEHRAPEGDQFLFVRERTGALHVEFVDPDAPESTAERAAAVPDGAYRALTLEAVALAGAGSDAELAFLTAEYETLRSHTLDGSWTETKAARLTAMAADGFWQREDRFTTLGLAEYMDRIEAGLRTAGSLLERLGATTSPPGRLVRRLSEQLYLIREALAELEQDGLGDCWLRVRAAHDPHRAEACNGAARRMADMYRAWAAKRRMKLQTLADGEDASGRYEALFALSGFGAHRILTPETGQHVFELPTPQGDPSKVRVAVEVAPQPAHPIDDPREAERVARRELDARFAVQPGTVVRRYREGPDPLVRDALRGWRTGKAETVLSGDFDLLG